MCAGVGRRWRRPMSGWTPGQIQLWLVCWRLMECGTAILCRAVIEGSNRGRGNKVSSPYG